MLGIIPSVAVFFGLPLEVRHVTLSTGQVTAAFAALGGLVGAAAIFAHDMRPLLLAFGRHVGIELERVKADRRRDFAVKLGQRGFKLTRADHAPRAHDIRPDVDRDRMPGHKLSHQRSR